MNKRLIKKGVMIFALVALGLMTAGGVLAADNSGLITPTNAPGTATGNNAYVFLALVTNWVLGIVGAVAVLFIIYGGFRYITAQGNSQQMDTAKNIIIKAIIGLVIVVVAYVLVQVIVAALVA